MPSTSWYRAAALLLAVAALARTAAAQDFPTRPITLIVAFSAGGYADSFARIVGARLGERLGQNVVIENHGGGGGNIAGANVAHAPPDGYTLLVTTSSVAVNETYYKKKIFAAADLKAVAIPAGAPETLSVNPTDPAKTLADVVRAGRAKPFDYASAGVGTASHVAAAYFFKILARIDPIHVPFQGGAPAVNAVVGGHVQVLVGTLPGYAAQFRSGTIRGVAVASPQRVAEVPDIPTYDESGYAGFVAENWVGVFAPAKIDREIAAKLNAAINEIVREPATEARLRTFSMQTHPRSLADTVRYFESEMTKWGTMVKAVGLSVE